MRSAIYIFGRMAEPHARSPVIKVLRDVPSPASVGLCWTNNDCTITSNSITLVIGLSGTRSLTPVVGLLGTNFTLLSQVPTITSPSPIPIIVSPHALIVGSSSPSPIGLP
uniref:Uncharacterized protein n=1 Tax=Aureoumbra lagunensis TaxID=44058 RepID=A0A7S3JT57_9STRA